MCSDIVGDCPLRACFFFSSRRRHTRCSRDWSSDVCSSDLTDTFGRAMADVWSQKLGTPVVIENRTGAGTLVGTEAVAKAAPDGYTLLLTTVAHAVNPYIHDKLGYRTEEDFAPVGLLARAPLVLVVDKRLPVQ